MTDVLLLPLHGHVRSADDTGVVELTNGCICCSKSADLVTAVWDMLQEADAGKIDYLLIETSGVSDPVSTIKPLEAEYGACRPEKKTPFGAA